jgi:uncharacterized protein (DUF2141 family)
MAIPTLTGFAPSVTFLENTVNATPQLLDGDVTFTDPDNNFTGGTLVVSGLLAEDVVSIRNQGTGAGLIGFSAGSVTFGGVAIGTATGGAGGTLTVTFNAAATSPAIEALIENLTYANNSNTPTAGRALTVQVTDAGGAGTGFNELAGAANLLAGIDLGTESGPVLGDIDGDGDLDIIVGNGDGNLFTITNTGTALAPTFGAPVQIGSIDVGQYAKPTLGDLDGDGDLDIVVGETDGGLFTITNTGTTILPSFAAPVQIDGINVSGSATPALGDVDDDGDLDIVVADIGGNLFTITNTGTTAVPAFGAPVQVTGIDVGIYAASALADLDGDGDLDIVMGNYDGNLFTITNTGTAAAPVFGAPVQVPGINSGGYSTPTFGDLDGDGDLDIVSGDVIGQLHTFLAASPHSQITVNVTAENDMPSLTGLAPSVGFTENSVNATPQLLNADVTFSDPDNNFSGGTLAVSGLLAEDIVSIRNQGTTAGQIGFSAGTVSFGGVAIGTATGGAGGTLTVTFNGAATSQAIETLIENLTYANSSNTPTASRTLTVLVTDAAGASTATNFAGLAGAANPLDGIDTGNFSLPALGDLNGDGDLDLIVGDQTGHLFAVTNTGSLDAPVFGAPVQVGSIDVGNGSLPALADLDGDDDLDIVAGNQDGTLFAITNTGSTTAPAFGAPVQIGSIDVGAYSAPALGDLDGDGDLDIVVGNLLGQLFTITNTGTTAAPVFGAPVQIGSIDVGNASTPTLGDIDSDGDLDIVVGESAGSLFAIRNTGTPDTPVFGALIQIAGTDVGQYSAPALGDFDGDGDLDIVSGDALGNLHTFLASSDRQITVNVTAQNDAPSGTNATIVAIEDAARVLTAADFGFGDADGHALTAVKVTTLPGAGQLTLNGAAVAAGQLVGIANINAGMLAFKGALNGNGAGYANITFQVQDNGGTASSGVDLDPSPNTLTLNLTAVNDAPSGTNKTVTTKEDVAYVLKAADFGFTDVDGNGFAAVRISTLPGLGKLTKNGAVLGVGATVSIAEINAGKLKFAPAKDLNGITSFTFQVRDNGGTLSGGVDLDPTPNKLTINVTAVLDIFTGNGAANLLKGSNDRDIFRGLGGNDTLLGLGGNDDLTGGLGADRQTGGLGKDTFFLTSLFDSAKSQSGLINGVFNAAQGSGLRDIITDFTRGQDKLNLATIDANTKIGGNQAFTWRGTGNFTGVAGQLIERLYNPAGTAGDKTIVYGDVNGDGKADFQIELTGLKVLAASDFAL